MKASKILALLSALITVFATATNASAQANTLNKSTISKAGRVATPGINTLLSGKGAPKSTTGIDGDFYIDTNKMNVYGPKVNGKWPAAVSMKGSAGASGTNGANGTNGTNGLTGATGAKGTSTTGSDGAPGMSGPSGPSGPSGSPGAPGATGATGPAGTGSPGAAGPAGSNGASGSNGTNGTNGLPGGTGDAGAKGDTGNTGLTGPAGSISPTMGLLTFTTMIGTSISTSSKNFGNFAIGKNYIVQLLLHGVSETGSSKLIKFSVSSPDSLIALTSDYVILNGYTSRSGFREQESSIVATVLVNGSNTTNEFSLTATITCDEGTTLPGLLFSGSFSAIQVGAIS
jgi:hypothetical protein